MSSRSSVGFGFVVSVMLRMRNWARLAIFATLALGAEVAMSGMAEAKDPPAAGPYPTTAAETSRLQNFLYNNQCYGNLQSSGVIDSRFGDDSRRALWVFLDTLFARYPEAKVANITTAARVFQILELNQVKDAAGRFCEGSQFRAEYFSDRNKHSDGSPDVGSGPDDRRCSRNEVARTYLAAKRPEYARLIQYLDLVINNYSAIFPDEKVDYTYGMNPAGIKKLKDFGKPGVTHAGTREALKAARDNYERLSFAQGINVKVACTVCYSINDYIFLRNIAQANGGYLIAKATKLTPPQRVEVARVTEVMLAVILKNVKIYRSIVARYNVVFEKIAALKPPNTPSDELLKELEGLEEARDAEMVLIVAGLRSKENDSSGSPLMRTQLQNYVCEGFTGEAVDQ
jgi:hypothetical protein